MRRDTAQSSSKAVGPYENEWEVGGFEDEDFEQIVCEEEQESEEA